MGKIKDKNGRYLVHAKEIKKRWKEYMKNCVKKVLMNSVEKAMATHSSTLAWKIPWMEEPGGLPSMGSQSRTRLKRLSSSSNELNYYYGVISHLEPDTVE